MAEGDSSERDLGSVWQPNSSTEPRRGCTGISAYPETCVGL